MKKLFLFAGTMILLNIALAQQTVYQETTRIQPINQQIPLIGSDAPSFNAVSTHGQISFPDDFEGNWKIIFAHPRNFTPVCSSEIIELAYNQDEFYRLGTNLIVISTDNISSHYDWKAALEEVYPNGKRNQVQIKFPLVADPSYEIANKYGMLDSRVSPGQNVRGVFFIDPDNKIRGFQFYPNEVGRNTEEIIRTLVALQTNYRDKTAILPANWMPGDDVMVPYLSPDEMEALDNPDSDIYSLTWFMNYKKIE
jgi:peroxiredoxin (alkyl hydroperoxide reductase subunit C)